MTTGENVPGDSEIVEMLIVHFQSSIKFNSHSAPTCYSNSVTHYTSGMYSYSSVSSSLPPHFFPFIMEPHPPFISSSFLLPSMAERGRLCKYHRRSGAYVHISHEASQHLIIRLSLHPSFSFYPPRPCSPPLSFLTPVSPLLISSCPNSSPSKFPLHPPTPPCLPLFPRCLSAPLFPPNAVRLTTLFPFKIKIIKSAAK